MNLVWRGAIRTGSSFRDAVERARGSSIDILGEEILPEGGGEGCGVMVGVVLRAWM